MKRTLNRVITFIVAAILIGMIAACTEDDNQIRQQIAGVNFIRYVDESGQTKGKFSVSFLIPRADSGRYHVVQFNLRTTDLSGFSGHLGLIEFPKNPDVSSILYSDDEPKRTCGPNWLSEGQLSIDGDIVLRRVGDASEYQVSYNYVLDGRKFTGYYEGEIALVDFIGIKGRTF